MSRRRSQATKRSLAAEAHAQRLLLNMTEGPAGEWWRPLEEAPEEWRDGWDGSIEGAHQSCRHVGDGAAIWWPSLDDVRRCPQCLLSLLRGLGTRAVAACAVCSQPSGVTTARHFLALQGHVVVARTICPACLG